MFKCISKTSFKELDQSNRRLYQFFFLSLLLYHKFRKASPLMAGI